MSDADFKTMEIIDFLKSKLKNNFKGSEIRPDLYGKTKIFLRIGHKANRLAIKILWEKFNARLNTISGVDYGETLGVVYHLTLDDSGIVLSLKTEGLSKNKPELDSISNIIQAASFMEREVHDLFGITFKGNTNMEKWIISDEWPDGKYPLRKDYKPGG